MNITFKPTLKVSTFVAELARKHGVVYQARPADALADQFTRLAGDDVKPLDRTQLLLIALRRAGHLSGREAMQLQMAHASQSKH